MIGIIWKKTSPIKVPRFERIVDDAHVHVHQEDAPAELQELFDDAELGGRVLFERGG
jgi:hypothetical protein